SNGQEEEGDEEQDHRQGESATAPQTAQEKHSRKDCPTQEEQAKRLVEVHDGSVERAEYTGARHKNDAEGNQKTTIRGEESSGKCVLSFEFPHPRENLDESSIEERDGYNKRSASAY